jgi:hypothetical protein
LGEDQDKTNLVGGPFSGGYSTGLETDRVLERLQGWQSPAYLKGIFRWIEIKDLK